MCNKKIKIREATIDDREITLAWRNDKLSASMFFDTSTVSEVAHEDWFDRVLKDVNRTIYIGELSNEKVGVCRFDFDKAGDNAEVSINLNPSMRGRGLATELLACSIQAYDEEHCCDLVAKVKPKNKKSLRLFRNAGFKVIDEKDSCIVLKRIHTRITFKEVEDSDCEILRELLIARRYNISHFKTPTPEEHEIFVRTHSYRYWAIVMNQEDPIGTFYLKYDNSIGINLLSPDVDQINTIISHVKDLFNPAVEVKSVVPPYFYVNVSYDNFEMQEVFEQIRKVPLQISYKI